MLLQMDKITKKYGEFSANRGIDFSLRAGEVHAIVGENGAGKTTLMRILYGMEQPTSGSIRLNGKEVTFSSPLDAIHHGIGMVHQHFMLFPSFTIAENIVIGNEPGSSARFDRKQAVKIVDGLCDQYGMKVDPRAVTGSSAPGIQQRVEILKVLYQGAEIIILDEPTGVLTPMEVQELLQAIKLLTKQGKSFILISHKLNEVLDVADRITVLRDGAVTGTVEKGETDANQLSGMMVGRELAELKKNPVDPGDKVLEVSDVTIRGTKGKPVLDGINLAVQAGEVVGIAGISGNGQSELLQVISGLMQPDQGRITLGSTDVTGMSTRKIREHGLAHIPEDRYVWGANREATVLDTGLMGHHRRLQQGGFLKLKDIRSLVSGWVSKFSIKTGSLETSTQYLSGGNLQKLIVARELEQGTPFLIAAEPTRGVDIGAMETIHGELLKRRDEGTGILLVSSELTEILKLSDRVLVMYEGRIAGELPAQEATEEKLGLLMAGGSIQ
ncbi:nucleoside ABC transporter ATP-binding protein [Paenibacillus uliginis N3/975]|uniref:Nucleoside ABC transporter ATP-binding protein n=1 Tax=Paenibacillus uliginis N3/975 TaxID=1313296 RepID=A0A1X7HQL5_9BACL|nr:ABC transporter ATP-binding protein [Paenibacillus uliginis]SMF89991.1 nucleoside ABC transporter ATP-binding protein [Paenibacillus uliginis N3/975]